jgi:hypothetical protein
LENHENGTGIKRKEPASLMFYPYAEPVWPSVWNASIYCSVDVTATVKRHLARQPIHVVILAEIGFRQIAVLSAGVLPNEFIDIVVYAMEAPIADLFSFDINLREYDPF